MKERPRIRSDSVSGNLLLRNALDPTQEPIVLIGRKDNDTDIGLAFHSFERAKELAFTIDGFRRVPFDRFDRDQRVEKLVTLLVEFSVSARRYLDLVSDEELGSKSMSNSELPFRFALNRLLHGVDYVPQYREVDPLEGSSRDTIVFAVKVRTNDWPHAKIDLHQLCKVFLDHRPAALWRALEASERCAAVERESAKKDLEKE